MLAAGMMDTTQGAAQRINLPLIGEFLAFGQLNQFEDFFHLHKRLTKSFDNMGHLADRLADGRTFKFFFGRRSRCYWLPGGIWKGLRGFSRLYGLNGFCGCGYWCRLVLKRRHGARRTAASTPTATTAAAADGRSFRRQWQIRFGRWFLRHLKSGWRECIKSNQRNHFFTNSASEAVKLCK